MTDNVLQSFCERCGTRFTQPAPPERPAPSPGVLGRFLRKAPDSVAAWPDSSALPISDAFRDTFRFCLECRRYNCADCWNDREGHCLSCRPLDEPAEPTPPLGTASSPAPSTDTTPSRPLTSGSAWPVDDLARAERATPERTADARGAGTSPWTSQAGDASAVSAASTATPEDTSSSPDLPWASAPALDPWRGVVFTAEDRGRVDPSVEPFTPPGEAHRVDPVVADPGVGPVTGVAAATDPGVPEIPADLSPPASDDLGVLASLIEGEPHVDAAGWARASSAVAGLGTLKTSRTPGGATPPVPGMPEQPAVGDEPAQTKPAGHHSEQTSLAEPVETTSLLEAVVEGTTPVVVEGAPAVSATEAILGTPGPVAPVLSRLPDEPGLDLGPPPHPAIEPVAVPPGSAIPPAPGPTVPTLPPELVATAAATSPPVSAEVPAGVLADAPAEAHPPLPLPSPVPPPTRAGGPPPPPRPPATPPPALAVWALPSEPGPFAQPYQPHPAQATVHPAPPPQASGPAASTVPDRTPAAHAQTSPAQVPSSGGIPPTVPAAAIPARPPAGPPPATTYVPRGPEPVAPAPAYVPAVSQPTPPPTRAPLQPSRPAATLRACPNCSLPLSTKARFCRRCGAPQPA
jgi:hypothetical protein